MPPRRHPLGPVPNQDEFSDKVWPIDGESLRDWAADRESGSVELLNAERVDECGCVLRHLFNRSRNFTARAGDAGVVEPDILRGPVQIRRSTRDPGDPWFR